LSLSVTLCGLATKYTPTNQIRTAKAEWALIPKFPLPGSFSKDYEAQDNELLKYPTYRTSKAIELFTGAVLNFVANNERIYKDKWGGCSDESSASHRVLGGIFNTAGFGVDYDHMDYGFDSLGRAVSRKF